MRVLYLRARDQTADLAQDIGVGFGSVPTLLKCAARDLR